MRIVSADIDGTRRFGCVDDEGVVHLLVTDRDPWTPSTRMHRRSPPTGP